MTGHVCRRFKQTGEMRMAAANIKIYKDGRRQQTSINVDAIGARCITCREVQWIDRHELEQRGNYLVRKGSRRHE
jgi:hypothetical protein